MRSSSVWTCVRGDALGRVPPARPRLAAAPLVVARGANVKGSDGREGDAILRERLSHCLRPFLRRCGGEVLSLRSCGRHVSRKAKAFRSNGLHSHGQTALGTEEEARWHSESGEEGSIGLGWWGRRVHGALGRSPRKPIEHRVASLIDYALSLIIAAARHRVEEGANLLVS